MAIKIRAPHISQPYSCGGCCVSKGMWGGTAAGAGAGAAGAGCGAGAGSGAALTGAAVPGALLDEAARGMGADGGGLGAGAGGVGGTGVDVDAAAGLAWVPPSEMAMSRYS